MNGPRQAGGTEEADDAHFWARWRDRLHRLAVPNCPGLWDISRGVGASGRTRNMIVGPMSSTKRPRCWRPSPRPGIGLGKTRRSVLCSTGTLTTRIGSPTVVRTSIVPCYVPPSQTKPGYCLPREAASSWRSAANMKLPGMRWSK